MTHSPDDTFREKNSASALVTCCMGRSHHRSRADFRPQTGLVSEGCPKLTSPPLPTRPPRHALGQRMPRALLVLVWLQGAAAAPKTKYVDWTSKAPKKVELIHPEVSGDTPMDPVAAIRQLFESLTVVVDLNTVSRREARVVYGMDEQSASSALQGHVFLMASMAAATATDADGRTADNLVREDMEAYALELFEGWRTMCERSKQEKQTCQIFSSGGKRPFSCGDGWDWTFERFPCLPHRRWAISTVPIPSLEEPLDSDSDAAADADAILAMIVLVVRFEGENKPWWREVGQWAYDSCKAFLHYNTETNAEGRERLVRLGSCRGGWACANPSYMSPGHYRTMRNFLVDFSAIFNNEKHQLNGAERNGAEHARIEASSLASQFDTVIALP